MEPAGSSGWDRCGSCSTVWPCRSRSSARTYARPHARGAPAGARTLLQCSVLVSWKGTPAGGRPLSCQRHVRVRRTYSLPPGPSIRCSAPVGGGSLLGTWNPGCLAAAGLKPGSCAAVRTCQCQHRRLTGPGLWSGAGDHLPAPHLGDRRPLGTISRQSDPVWFLKLLLQALSIILIKRFFIINTRIMKC